MTEKDHNSSEESSARGLTHNIVDTREFVTEQWVLEEYGAGRIFPPLSVRNPWVASRLVLMPEGTTVQMIRLLAKRRFGDWDEKVVKPMWVDGDYHNEREGNVHLVEVAVDPMKRKSSYGVAAGTPEYRRRWREANSDRIKASQQRSYANRKRLIALGRGEMQRAEVKQAMGGEEVVAAMEDQDNRMRLLAELEAMAEGNSRDDHENGPDEG